MLIQDSHQKGENWSQGFCRPGLFFFPLLWETGYLPSHLSQLTFVRCAQSDLTGLRQGGTHCQRKGKRLRFI